MIGKKGWSLFIIGLIVGSFSIHPITAKGFVRLHDLDSNQTLLDFSSDELFSPWNNSWSDVSAFSFDIYLSLPEHEYFEGIGCLSLKLKADGDHVSSPGYIFSLIDNTSNQIVTTILLTSSFQNNYSYTLWSTFGSSQENLVSSNLILRITWINEFAFRNGKINLESGSLSFHSFPEMNSESYYPFFPNSSLFFVLDSFRSEIFFSLSLWINPIFALDESSNFSSVKFTIVYDLILDEDFIGSEIDRGSISAYDRTFGDNQQIYLDKQDLSSSTGHSISWDYSFIPRNHTLFFKISLQGSGRWFFKLQSVNLESTISPKEDDIISDLIQQDAPLTIFFTIIFLFAPISIRLSFFKKKPRTDEIDDMITSEVILIEDRSD